MKILAASLVDAAEAFLHPGYISAHPRSFEPAWAYPPAEPAWQLDVAQALRLEPEALSGAAATSDVVLPTTASVGGGPWLLTLGAVLASFAALAFIHLLGDGRPSRRRAAGWLAATATAGLLLACGQGGPGAQAPSHGPGPPSATTAPPSIASPGSASARSAYADPRAATLALMHGVLYDALANVGGPVRHWQDIRLEVALPQAQLTAGERHALAHYHIDGWGHELWLQQAAPYRVVSAGADGVFRTGDDIEMVVPPCTDENWDQRRRAFFVRKAQGRYVVLFHRWTGEHFRYRNEQPARALTGSALFDLFVAERLAPEQRSQLARTYEAMAAQGQHEPLLLQVFSGPA